MSGLPVEPNTGHAKCKFNFPFTKIEKIVQIQIELKIPISICNSNCDWKYEFEKVNPKSKNPIHNNFWVFVLRLLEETIEGLGPVFVFFNGSENGPAALFMIKGPSYGRKSCCLSQWSCLCLWSVPWSVKCVTCFTLCI